MLHKRISQEDHNYYTYHREGQDFQDIHFFMQLLFEILTCLRRQSLYSSQARVLAWPIACLLTLGLADRLPLFYALRHIHLNIN
jgi:hypothetical protein